MIVASSDNDKPAEKEAKHANNNPNKETFVADSTATPSPKAMVNMHRNVGIENSSNFKYTLNT